MPLFSIVVPTRDRARLLGYTLQSIAAQDFTDYEIVVSDNHSTDNTKQVVDAFAEPRLRYIRPEKYLRMYDHWEFARQYAQGDYLLFLGDDDCLSSCALSELARVIHQQSPALVGCGSIEYYTSDYWVKAQQNHIQIGNFSHALLDINAHVALSECFRFNPHPFYYPRVTVPVMRSLVESIANQAGRFFDSPNPEYVGFAMVYARIERFPFLDSPLVVLGHTPVSLGPRYFWSNQDPSWGETTANPFGLTPLKGTYMTNGAAESFLKAKNNLPDRFQGIELSQVDYYQRYYNDMLTQRWLGRDIQGDLEEFYRVVELLPLDIRGRVRDSIREIDLRAPLWRKMLRKSKMVFAQMENLVVSEMVLGEQSAIDKYWLDGDQIGVSDILSCVKWLDAHNNQIFFRR